MLMRRSSARHPAKGNDRVPRSSDRPGAPTKVGSMTRPTRMPAPQGTRASPVPQLRSDAAGRRIGISIGRCGVRRIGISFFRPSIRCRLTGLCRIVGDAGICHGSVAGRRVRRGCRVWARYARPLSRSRAARAGTARACADACPLPNGRVCGHGPFPAPGRRDAGGDPGATVVELWPGRATGHARDASCANPHETRGAARAADDRPGAGPRRGRLRRRRVGVSGA